MSDRVVTGEKVDTDGTGNYFETDQPLGAATPTLYMELDSPASRLLLEEVRYMLDPTDSETYELYLLEGPEADAVTRKSKVVFDSGVGKTKGKMYIATMGQGKLPILCELDTRGRLYYMVDWSGTPGNTPGYIKVRGRVVS